MAKKYDPQAGSLFKKEVPEMPEGYYSGDKPNPNLRAFVEQHLKERPYDPESDDYDVPAFDKPIETTKATAIYNMHTYWSKKPHDAIRQYIRHYTKPGDLVLDPFCGSGGTALAALMEGRKAVAIDRSPAATFITKNYCTPVDVHDLYKAFEQLKHKVKKEIDWLYETRCDRCGGKATTTYTVYSQVFQCPRCLEKVALFDCVEVEGTTAKGKLKKINACPHCHKRGIVEEISTSLPRKGFEPVLFGYECVSCKPKRGSRHISDFAVSSKERLSDDLSKIAEVEKTNIPYPVPEDRMMHSSGEGPWGVLWRPYHEGINLVKDFFTKRNLWAILAIKEAIRSLNFSDSLGDFLMCGVSAILYKSSRLMGYREDGIGRVLSGTYWLPPLQKDINVWSYYEEWFADAQRHIVEKGEQLCGLKELELVISTSSATNLQWATSNSVDYIFTDPPYSWKVQYGEANFLWESILGLDSRWHHEEIIVNEIRGKSESDWAEMMRHVICESFRVLKPGRWLSLCYHDTSEGTWSLIQDLMAECGFIPDQAISAIFIDADQKSLKQITSARSNKRDLVINFRKPRPGEVTATIAITGDEDKTTFAEKVRQIIRDHLGANPGSTKDRIYDEVVSRMVRSGQMEAHDFDELIRTVAEEVKTPVKKDLFRNEEPDIFGTHEIGRWYLKETELVIADAAENAREDAAAEKIGAFIKGFLKKNLGDEGVHYSDLFEHYIYAVKDKPRRQLAEFLPDYFYKTDQGTWRLPASEEEEKAKREARVKGLGRRVKRYISQLEQGAIIPDHDRPNDVTLAEWIRHCKRAGLYEQGKLLYEKGGLNTDNLPEEAMVNVEEDYQVCARMLAREASVPKRRSRKKAED